MEYIGEQVAVMASFGAAGKLKPVKFLWSGRVIQVQEVTYSWMDRIGQRTIHHFAVTDGSTLYELGFDPSAVSWTLEKVETQW